MIGPQLPPGGHLHSQHHHGEQHQELVSLTSVMDLQCKARVTVGRGLQNLGNSCYLNSVLQALAHLPAIQDVCQRHCLHGFNAACPLRRKGQPCTACLVQEQITHQTSGSISSVRPDGIFTNLHLFCKSFVRGRQEDAHELLVALLDAVERDSRKGLVHLGYPKTTQTLIEQLFCGRLVNNVKCEECGHVSSTFETITTLSLDLYKVNSVEQSWAQYTAVEVLDGANKYKCDRCNKLVRACKWVAWHDQPNVLVIHLKRFNALSLSSKVGKPISFPILLHLASRDDPHTAPADGSQQDGQQPPREYVLSGLVVHSGASVHSGHYYAYVREAARRWHCCNDSSVYSVDASEVLDQQAYLLFYSRRTLKPVTPLPEPPAAGTQQAGAAGNGSVAPAVKQAAAGSRQPVMVSPPQRPPGGGQPAQQEARPGQPVSPPISPRGSGAFTRTSFVLAPKQQPGGVSRGSAGDREQHSNGHHQQQQPHRQGSERLQGAHTVVDRQQGGAGEPNRLNGSGGSRDVVGQVGNGRGAGQQPQLAADSQIDHLPGELGVLLRNRKRQLLEVFRADPDYMAFLRSQAESCLQEGLSWSQLLNDEARKKQRQHHVRQCPIFGQVVPGLLKELGVAVKKSLQQEGAALQHK